MDQALIEAMQDYFRAGEEMDLDRMDALYDPDFINIRTDQAGRTVTLTKAQFMGQFRAMQAQGRRLESSADAEFLATSHYGEHGSVLIRRVKDGQPVNYNFVWRLADDRPVTLVREFTHETDLSALLALLSP